MIYLDYASSTPAAPEVIAEFCRVEREFHANPLSVHESGQAAKDELDRITARTAELLGAKSPEVLFTSGATEANRLAVGGLALASRHAGKHILTSCLEHPSVSGPLAALKEQGYEIEMADILSNGTVDLEHIAALLRRDTVLLTIPWVDSELGAIQPVSDIVKILKQYPNCRLHVDAAQAVGKVSVSFEGIDTLSFSPHKFHGICGSGVLLQKENVASPGGTPALGLAASALKALELATEQQDERLKKVQALRLHVIQAMKRYPDVCINSPMEGSPNILNLSVAGVKGDEFQTTLNRQGIYVSVKSACSAPGTLSRPVFAVSKNKKTAMSSWRISFSHSTEMAEIETFLKVFDNERAKFLSEN